MPLATPLSRGRQQGQGRLRLFAVIACAVGGWVALAATTFAPRRTRASGAGASGSGVTWVGSTEERASAICRALHSREACLAGIDVEGGPSSSCLWCCGASCWPGLRSGLGVRCEAATARLGARAAHFTQFWESPVRAQCMDGYASPAAAQQSGAQREEESSAGEGEEEHQEITRASVPLVGGLPMEFPPAPPQSPDIVGLAVQLRRALHPYHFGYGSDPADGEGAPVCGKWGEMKPDTFLSGCVDDCKPRMSLLEAKRECVQMGPDRCGGIVATHGHFELREGPVMPSKFHEDAWVSPCKKRGAAAARHRSTPQAPEVWETFREAVEAALVDPALRLGAKPPAVRSDDSVLVSVASYRDNKCPGLVRSAFTQAERPDKVSVAIVQQNCNRDCQVGTGWANTRKVVKQPLPDPDCIKDFCDSAEGAPHCAAGRVRILRLEERESYGPFFARYIATKQWRGETFFVQLDAHSDFRKHWDTNIIGQLKRTPSYPNSVISNYPPGHMETFRDDGTPSALCGVTFETLAGAGPHRRITVRLAASGRSYDGDLSRPRHSAFIAAGFYAAHSSFIHKFDFDPFMPFLFMGEEIAMTARFWTHGFDVYGPTTDIVRHEYIRKEAMKFWESVGMVFSNGGMHNALTHLIIPRVQHLVGFSEARDRSKIEPASILTHMDQFGLGKERTLEQFLDVMGLDMVNKKMLHRTWCSQGTEPKGDRHDASRRRRPA